MGQFFLWYGEQLWILQLDYRRRMEYYILFIFWKIILSFVALKSMAGWIFQFLSKIKIAKVPSKLENNDILFPKIWYFFVKNIDFLIKLPEILLVFFHDNVSFLRKKEAFLVDQTLTLVVINFQEFWRSKIFFPQFWYFFRKLMWNF